MKAPQSYLHFFKLPRRSKIGLTEPRRLEEISKRLAASFRRFVGTGERLRATLGDEE
jgi:hypothetical protein